MPETIPSSPAGTSPDPAQHHRLTDHGLRSALEHLERVPIVDASLVYDLGCGSGTSTRMIAERCAGARVVGVDSSEILRRASENPSRIEWLRADVAGWEPERTLDLIYSSATLHWLDNHATLLPRLLGFLAPGGCLAVQVPLPLATLARADGRNRPERRRERRASGCSKPTSITTCSLPMRRRFTSGRPSTSRVSKATGLRPILILNGLRGDDLKRFIEVCRERPRRAGGLRTLPASAAVHGGDARELNRPSRAITSQECPERGSSAQARELRPSGCNSKGFPEPAAAQDTRTCSSRHARL